MINALFLVFFCWRNSLRVKSLTFQNSGLSSASEWYCVSDYEWHLWQTWYTSINYQNLKKLSVESILVRFCQPCKVRKKLLLEQINFHSNISDVGGEENLCGLLALGSWVRCGALAHCVTISLFTPTLIMMMTMNMVTMVMVMLHINMLPIFSQCSPPTIASSKMFIFFLSMLSSNIYWFQVGKFVERMVNGAEQDFDFYHSAQSGETFPSSNNVLSYLYLATSDFYLYLEAAGFKFISNLNLIFHCGESFWAKWVIFQVNCRKGYILP